MSWDPALLRKYSNTNHYKLLSQVRSDLKQQPIQRSTGTAGRRGGGSAGSGTSRRRIAPVAAPQPAREEVNHATSFDSFVTVPVLIGAFE